MNKQMKRNKYFFGLGTVGRDALYSLVSMYLINHLTDVVGFSDWGTGVIGVMLMLFGIFDAVIDPFVGKIVDNTKTKWGKFKPWMVGGMIGTGLLTLLMFHNFRMDEVSHIVLLGATYLLFSMFFSANDIAYWSLMPAISKDQKEREGIGSFARICANVGMFSMVIVYTMVPDLFSFMGLNARDTYFIFTGLVVLLMWGFQLFTILGVREDRSYLEKQEHTSIKDMFAALLGNDQLMVTAVSMALFMIGYCTTTAFGVYYFDYAYKDGGMYIVFAGVLAVAQLTALVLFPLFRRKFTRKQLYFGSMVAVVISYIVFFLSFEWLPLILLAGLGLFFAQAFIQLLMLLFLADAIEYGEWKLGRRNESVSFAVQPFINQFGSAISKGVVTTTLIISGINEIANAVAKADGNPTLQQQLRAATPGDAIWILKISMMILPLICILVGFIIYHKKFKIDEEMYARILSDLEARKAVEGSCATKDDAPVTVVSDAIAYSENTDMDEVEEGSDGLNCSAKSSVLSEE